MRYFRITALVTLSVICLFFLRPLLGPGFYLSHDGEVHVARFAAYYKALEDGQILPRWAGDLNYRYGSAVFIFYYPLPGFLASFIHVLGMSFESAFKLLMIVSFIGNAIFFYLWMRTKVKGEIAFVGALFYALAPYHFLNVYVRGDIAEMMALALAPLVLLFIDKITSKPTVTTVALGSLTYAFLILSHNAVSLMFSFAIFGYTLLQFFKQGGGKQLIYQYTSILVLGLALSAFFWIPALYESRFTNANLFIGDMFKEHFPPPSSLIYSSWGFGPDVNRVGGLSPQIGPLHISFIFFGLLLFLRKAKRLNLKLFWTAIFFLAVFMTISVSSWVWEHVPLVKLFQFPWRFTALSSFAASVIGVFVLSELRVTTKILSILAILLFLLSLPFMQVEKQIGRDDEYYFAYKGTTSYHGQASSIWTAGDPGEVAKNSLEVIEGEAAISQSVRKSNLHSFLVDATSNVKILDNTFYFPGWQVRVDGRKVPIQFQDANHRGLITFSVPQGKHEVEVSFNESPIRLFSDIISLISVFFVTIALLLRKRLNVLLMK